MKVGYVKYYENVKILHSFLLLLLNGIQNTLTYSLGIPVVRKLFRTWTFRSTEFQLK